MKTYVIVQDMPRCDIGFTHITIIEGEPTILISNLSKYNLKK